MCETNKRKIRTIQYKSLRIAYRKPIKTSNTELLKLANTTSVDERINQLNNNYFDSCYKNNNELVMDIIKNYNNWYTINRDPNYKTILCNYKITIQKMQI